MRILPLLATLLLVAAPARARDSVACQTPEEYRPSELGGAIGTALFFAQGFTWPGPRLTLTHPAALTSEGYGQKVIWRSSVGFKGVVTVRGRNLATGETILFKFLNAEPGTTVRLDAASPPVSEAGRAVWPSAVYFPALGCHEVVVEWEDGGWRTVFEVRR
jgi:hypothetical protein